MPLTLPLLALFALNEMEHSLMTLHPLQLFVAVTHFSHLFFSSLYLFAISKLVLCSLPLKIPLSFDSHIF